jgi:hypothetical protein
MLLHADVDAVVECPVFDREFGPYHIYRCDAKKLLKGLHAMH